MKFATVVICRVRTDTLVSRKICDPQWNYSYYGYGGRAVYMHYTTAIRIVVLGQELFENDETESSPETGFVFRNDSYRLLF
jgi:hypothetical protein